MYTFKETKHIDINSLKPLYEDVGWFAYTQDIERTRQAVVNSLYVLTAWEGERLIGLARVVGDGLTIIYLQDILVLQRFQNKGIASEMVKRIMEKFKDVRQKVLLTEEAPDVRHFYEKAGFSSCDQGKLVAFARLD